MNTTTARLLFGRFWEAVQWDPPSTKMEKGNQGRSGVTCKFKNCKAEELWLLLSSELARKRR